MPTQEQIDLTDKLINESSTRQTKRRTRDKYYHGAQRLRMMGLSTPPEMRHLQTVINWTRTTVDALAERLDVEGFRTGNKQLDKVCWDWWKRSNMRVQSDAGHIESLVQGAGFIVVSKDPKNPDRAVFSVESSAAISVKLDAFGNVVAATRYYRDPDDDVEYSTLYLPDVTIWMHRERGTWIEDDRDVHELGIVPVIPLVNRVRINDPFGETEMKDVMSIVDAVCRTATNLSTASETLAVPSRYVFGASREDFVDAETGEPVPVWEGYLGRLNAITNPDGSVVQLSGADLKNFTETITMYGKLVSSLTGLPIHYLGVTTDGNPASAEAIAAGEARHVKRAERKQECFGLAWSLAMYVGCLLVFGESARDLQIDTVWRDASTPTTAAKTDAVVKLKQVGLIPVEGAWIELGYDQEKRDLYRSLMSDDPLERLVAQLANEPAQPSSTPAESEPDDATASSDAGA